MPGFQEEITMSTKAKRTVQRNKAVIRSRLRHAIPVGYPGSTEIYVVNVLRALSGKSGEHMNNVTRKMEALRKNTRREMLEVKTPSENEEYLG